MKNSQIHQALVLAIELGLKILKEPKKFDDYLVKEEDKEVVDEVEENFVERLLSETGDEKSESRGVIEGEAYLEEMFVDSMLEETVCEDIASPKHKKNLNWEFERIKYEVE